MSQGGKTHTLSRGELNEAKPASPDRLTKTIPKAYQNEAKPASPARLTKSIPKAYQKHTKMKPNQPAQPDSSKPVPESQKAI